MIQYCEQLTAINGFEPWNAFSNAAFVVAASAAWGRARATQIALRGGVLLLVLLALAIGIGSFLWHATHAAWAELADVIPILCFVLVYLYNALTVLLRYRPRTALAGCITMVIAIVAVLYFARFALNGSAAYLPVLGGVMLVASAASGPQAKHTAGLAALVFAVSLCARSADLLGCPSFPIGLHWLWHLCNGLVIYLAQKSLIDAYAAPRAA